MTQSAVSVGGWRKSTYSGVDGCVELSETTDGRVLVRNSKVPDHGSVVFTRHEIDAFVRGVVAGEFDDFR